MYYGPNEQATSVILDISNKLLSQNILINLIGDTPEDIVSRLKNRKNIIFHNYQKNILPILKKCSLALAPISTGSGMRIKILELASYGIPTIGFPAAFEGIPRSANIGIVVNSANEMFIQTTKLCSDYGLLQRLGANAYGFIKSSCSGKDICQAIEEMHRISRRNNKIIKKNINLPPQPVWIQELIDKGKYERT